MHGHRVRNLCQLSRDGAWNLVQRQGLVFGCHCWQVQQCLDAALWLSTRDPFDSNQAAEGSRHPHFPTSSFQIPSRREPIVPLRKTAGQRQHMRLTPLFASARVRRPSAFSNAPPSGRAFFVAISSHWSVLHELTVANRPCVSSVSRACPPPLAPANST